MKDCRNRIGLPDRHRRLRRIAPGPQLRRTRQRRDEGGRETGRDRSGPHRRRPLRLLHGAGGRPERHPDRRPDGGHSGDRHGRHRQPGLHLRDGGRRLRHGDDPGRDGGHHPRRRDGAHVGDPLLRPRPPAGAAASRTRSSWTTSSTASMRARTSSPAWRRARSRRAASSSSSGANPTSWGSPPS